MTTGSACVGSVKSNFPFPLRQLVELAHFYNSDFIRKIYVLQASVTSTRPTSDADSVVA